MRFFAGEKSQALTLSLAFAAENIKILWNFLNVNLNLHFWRLTVNFKALWRLTVNLIQTIVYDETFFDPRIRFVLHRVLLGNFSNKHHGIRFLGGKYCWYLICGQFIANVHSFKGFRSKETPCSRLNSEIILTVFKTHDTATIPSSAAYNHLSQNKRLKGLLIVESALSLSN